MDNKAETIGMVEFKIKVIENFSSFRITKIKFEYVE